MQENFDFFLFPQLQFGSTDHAVRKKKKPFLLGRATPVVEHTRKNTQPCGRPSPGAIV